ncbi:MAG: PorV/PorQ family protein [Bacteroidota bacterium]
MMNLFYPRTFLSLLIGLFLSASISAQVKYSNEFLSLGVGARAQGMSTAQVANVSDVMSTYWNPAGLVYLDAPLQLGIMHAEWFAGIAQYDYIGFAKPLNPEKQSAIGLSIIRLGIDNIPNTLNLIGADGSINYENVTEFSAADYAVFFSYAQNVKIKGRTFAMGGNAKIIRRVIGTFGNSWGFGIDFGIQYRGDKWQFGLMARDVTSTFNAWSFGLTDREKLVFETTGNDIPESSVEVTRPQFILGAARKFRVNSKVEILAEMNWHFTTDGQRNVLVSSEALNIDPFLGVELGYRKTLFLRTGVGKFQESLDDDGSGDKIWTFQPTLGVGLKIGRFFIDYAFTDVGNVSQVQYSNIFSVKLNFKERKKLPQLNTQ